MKWLMPIVVIFASAEQVHAGVIIDGKEWRQLTETVGFSWNDITTVCPSGGGVCVGSIGTTDFTGWTWATVSEVADLFAFLTPHPGGVFDYQETQSTWAPAVFELFNPTHVDIGSTRLTGFAATPVPSRNDLAYAPEILDRPELFGHLPDHANTANVRGVNLSGNVDNPGVWLYRNVDPVPEPSTIALFGIGCVFLAGYRRRQLLVA